MLICAVLLSAISACTTSDDEGETPTPPPTTTRQTATPASGGLTTPTTSARTPLATSGAAETVIPATFGAANGQTISDRLCTATIPDGWVDSGTGNGTTASNADYVLFGGRLNTDTAWQEGIDLIKKQNESRPDVEITEGDGFIRVNFANDSGFEYRARFEDRYCDFSVTNNNQPIPAEDRAFWDAIIASLAPVSA